MKILDFNNQQVLEPDLEKGYLQPDRLFVAHHEAVEAVAAQGHYEITEVFPNGGKNAAWIIDVPGVEAQDAWDEYEDIMRYCLYTDEELALRNKPTLEQRIEVLEAELRRICEVLTDEMLSFLSNSVISQEDV